MKKIYSFMLLAVIGMLSFAANAINITINVDDPSRVMVQISYQEKQLVAGDNKFDVPEYASVQISSRLGYILNSVMKGDVKESVYNLSNCYISVYSTDENAVWTVKSSSLDDARTASCKVTVDDASKVRMSVSGTNSQINLVNGENVVKFIPEVESTIMFSSTDYYKPLYSVEYNGKAVTASSGNFVIEGVADGSKINVAANYPDVSVPVKFNLSEKSAGFITKVTVDNNEVTNYADANFTVKAGSSVTIYGNTTDYMIDKFNVNGSSISFYGSYTFTVTSETTIDIDAHKYGMVKVVLDIDNPANVTVYKGYSYNGTKIDLVAGKNNVEVNENNSVISFSANSGCFITSVTDGTNEYKNSGYVNVTEGMTITFKTGAIQRDDQFVLYIDDATASPYGINMGNENRYSISGLGTGYNVAKFDAKSDNPFRLSFYGASAATIYQNGKVVDPVYAGTANFEIKVADGDVIKAYLKSVPTKVKATFSVIGEASNVEVKKDIITTVADWTNGIEDFAGTQITLAAKTGAIKVKADGKDVEANEDGVFAVTLSKNTEIEVTVATGVAGINADKAADNNVYNINGVLVIKNATQEQIENLDKGFYIINGKKVIR